MHCAFIYFLNAHCLKPRRAQRLVGLDFPLPSLLCCVTLQIRSCGPAVGRWYPRGNVRKVETNTGKTWPRCYIRIENIRAEKASYLQRLQRPRRWNTEKGAYCSKDAAQWKGFAATVVVLKYADPDAACLQLFFASWLLALFMWWGDGVNRALRGGHESSATKRRVCAAQGEKSSPVPSTMATDKSPTRAPILPLCPVVMYLRVVCTPEYCFLLYHYNYSLFE